MSIVFTDSVYFYVKAVGRQKFFVKIGPVGSDCGLPVGWEELATVVLSLAEQDTVARASWAITTVMNVDLMVLGIDWLF